MEHKKYNNYTKDMDGFPSDYYSGYNSPKPIDNNPSNPENNLRNKLNNAFTDLESLRKALKDIRSNNDTIINKNDTNTNNPYGNKYDFFSDDRYNHVLNQIKDSNNDKNKKNNIPSSNKLSMRNTANFSSNPQRNYNEHSRDKQANERTYNNNSLFKNNKENTSKDRSPLNLSSVLQRNKRFENSMNNSAYDNNINPDNKKNYENNINNSFNNSNKIPNLYSTNNKYSYISLREEIERLKISNQILLNSNTDLKNEVMDLNKELELQYHVNKNSIEHAHSLTPKKHSSKKLIDDEGNSTPFNELIESMKNSLAVTKNHNQELAELVEITQKKNSDLHKENSILKEQHVNLEKDLDKLTKTFEETRHIIESFKNQVKHLENDKSQNYEFKKDIEEKLFLAEEQIINLISINEGHLKTKKDNLEVIESLRKTIEIIKKGGYSDEEGILELKIKLEENENTINQKNYIIKNMSDNINNFEKDREYFNHTLNNLKDEISDKEKFIEELEGKYRLLFSDCEKASMRAETLQCKLDEKEQTIDNLKSSIDFINDTMEEYKVDYDKIKSDLDFEKSDKIKLIKNIESTKEKFSDLTIEIEDLQESKNTLQKKILEIDKELKEKKNLLTKANFENNHLDQQLQEAKNIIEQLKDELKSDKIFKINEEFQNEIAKSNEERIKKIDELRLQLDNKAKEIEKITQVYEENLRNKDDKTKELSRLLSRAEKINSDNELNFNSTVNKLNYTIEEFKREISNLKTNHDSEKRSLQHMCDEYQRQIKDLKINHSSLENNFNIRKNFDNVTPYNPPISNIPMNYYTPPVYDPSTNIMKTLFNPINKINDHTDFKFDRFVENLNANKTGNWSPNDIYSNNTNYLNNNVPLYQNNNMGLNTNNYQVTPPPSYNTNNPDKLQFEKITKNINNNINNPPKIENKPINLTDVKKEVTK